MPGKSLDLAKKLLALNGVDSAGSATEEKVPAQKSSWAARFLSFFASGDQEYDVLMTLGMVKEIAELGRGIINARDDKIDLLAELNARLMFVPNSVNAILDAGTLKVTRIYAGNWLRNKQTLLTWLQVDDALNAEVRLGLSHRQFEALLTVTRWLSSLPVPVVTTASSSMRMR